MTFDFFGIAVAFFKTIFKKYRLKIPNQSHPNKSVNTKIIFLIFFP